MQFDDTRIYRRSLELIDMTKNVLESLPTGFGFLADQLRRASSSVLLNLAEGCGHQTKGQRRRHFHIARGSVLEVAAAADIAHRFGVITKEDHHELYDICDHISAMLYRFR